MMVIAVLLGVIAGFLAFVPLIFGLRMTKHVTATSNFSHASILLLCILASIAILGIAVFACIVLAQEVILPFVIAEAIALSITAIGFGIYTNVRKG